MSTGITILIYCKWGFDPETGKTLTPFIPPLQDYSQIKRAKTKQQNLAGERSGIWKLREKGGLKSGSVLGSSHLLLHGLSCFLMLYGHVARCSYQNLWFIVGDINSAKATRVPTIILNTDLPVVSSAFPLDICLSVPLSLSILISMCKV